jgi:hypothetical protein
MSWVALLGPKRTDEQLAAIRALAVADWGELRFTCDECPAKSTCEFAFDPYNIAGDCLAEK